MIVDDYGHHPAEIEATLDAAQRGFDRRVVVAFQPHRYTRTHALFDEFTRAFNKADVLLVTEVYPAGESADRGRDGRGAGAGDPRARASRRDLRRRQEARRRGAARGGAPGRHRHRARRGRHQRERARAQRGARVGGRAVKPRNRRVPAAESLPAPDEVAGADGGASDARSPRVAREGALVRAVRTVLGAALVLALSTTVAWAARRHIMTSPASPCMESRSKGPTNAPPRPSKPRPVSRRG